MNRDAIADNLETGRRLVSAGVYGDDLETFEASMMRKFTEEMKNIRAQVVKMSTSREDLDHGYTSQIQALLLSRKFAECGGNVFNLTESLASLLLLTDLTEVPPLPFDAFAIRIPGGFVSQMNDWVTVIRVAKYKSGAGREKVLLMAGTSDPTRPVDMFSTFLSELGDGPNTESWAQKGLPGIEERSEISLRRIAAGLCHFIAAKIEPLTLENERAVARETTRPRVFVVGRTVKISRELRELSRMAPGSGPRWKLQNRYVVRGHFRWQPIGRRLPDGHEGPQNAKKTWIEPHWKGPEGAEAWQHLYEVSA